MRHPALPVMALLMAVLLAAAPLGCGTGGPEAAEDAADGPARGHRPGEDQGHGHEHDHGPGEDHGHDHDHGTESAGTGAPSGADDYGIRVERVEPVSYTDMIKIPGVVAEAPERRAQVSAPTMVRVAALDLPPKSTARAGQRLAVLELADPEVRQLQMRAVELRAELLAAATERDRTRAYLDQLRSQPEPMVVEIRRMEADLTVLEARAAAPQSALDATLASLKVVGLSEEQLLALENAGTVATRIEVFAPRLEGSPPMEVSERPVSVGETLPAGSPIYSLVALDRLLAIGEAFEADLADVRAAARADLPVSIYFPAEGRTVNDLRIAAVEGTLDGANRVTHFLVPFPNRLLSEKTVNGARFLDWENRVGARIQLLVSTSRSALRFVVPDTALIRETGRAAVFVREGTHRYRRVYVTPDALDAGMAVLPLDCGLAAGDQVVVEGALQVKLARQQEGGAPAADGSDHGHQH